MRGIMGYDTDPNFTRYKYDCLQYYQEDIGWFSFIAVTLSLHMLCLYKQLAVPTSTETSIKVFFSAWMLVSRLVQLWFMMPFRHADRSYTEIKPMAWVGLGLFELVGPVAVCFLENMGHSITVAVCIIDSIVFIGQFVMY